MSFLDSELSSLMAATHKALFKIAVIVMGDITNQGVSLCSVVMLLSDMSGREPLYKKEFVFFSSIVLKEFENYIKSDTSVLPCIGALREV
ncbi:hypothetical protein ACB092_02G240800 [Castanea dentata]